jgi:hypothetical protein
VNQAVAFADSVVTVNGATYTLRIPQRASLLEIFRFPYSGINCNVYAKVWNNRRRERVLLDLTTTWINRHELYNQEDLSAVRSTIALTADWQETKNVTRNGYWDLVWIWPDGLREYPVRGPSAIDLNSTEEPSP